mmetsp:Transcript_30026/g.69953  ORF Transcript_30026/g.69953 Transcript_30026/m.69953 type:complete len:224 (+) Transcript_30026:2463-3134(+)
MEVRAILERNAQRGKNRSRCEQLPFILAEILLQGFHEHKILQARKGVEEVVLALPKDLPEVLVVHGTEMRLRTPLVHELENLSGGAVRLAPQIQLCCDLQLSATRLECSCHRVYVVWVHLVGRCGASALLQLLIVLPQGLTEPLELLRPLVLAAEIKSMPSGLMVDLLQSRIRLEDIEDHLVGVPQEAEVHVHIPILALLPSVLRLDCAEKDGLWSLHLIEVF